MSTLNWPPQVRPGSVSYSIEYDVQIVTMRGGRVDTYGLPGARWVATIGFDNEPDLLRARAEALVASFRGGARRIYMPHFGRPVPNGGLRGAPVLASAVAPGSNTLALANCNAGLVAGDIIGLLTQLHYVEEDVDPAAGAMTVKVSPAPRTAANAGTAVVWNRPNGIWIPKSNVAGPFPYSPAGDRPPFSIELVDVG